ncbi:MAG TPA: T9SS type A sorting domain-containing protein [Bacteroidales bacterium]|nr:T9SS type A sorting domain-containing protein [Bacteroidales bacterium]
MFKRIKILIILLVLSWANVISQHLSHEVLVPAAGLASSNSLSYSQTIGETAIEIISCSGYVLTQGFQQPAIAISQEEIPEGNGVEVYPNPATDFINIKLFGDVTRKFKIDIIKITGTIVSSTTIDFTDSYYYIQRFDVDQLKRGLYYVRVISMDGLINRSFKIEKM